MSAFAWDRGSYSCPASAHDSPWAGHEADATDPVWPVISTPPLEFTMDPLNVSAMDQSSSATGLEDRLLDVDYLMVLPLSHHR